VTLQDLGNLGEFAAAVATLITLVYLAIQVRQNTRAVRNSTVQEIGRDLAAGMDQLNPDPALNRIWYEGIRDFGALSQEEQRRFASYFTSVLRRYENLLYQTRHGTLDPDAWLGVRRQLGFAFAQAGTVVWWKQAKNLFHPDLVKFIDNEICTIQVTQPRPPVDI
jgi:hypothetical protein